MTTDCDVLIAGAGLVGQALAPALAAAGLTVVLADRAPMTLPEAPAGDSDWDSRVYAISPGSASLLRALGAWQALPSERITPIEARSRGLSKSARCARRSFRWFTPRA